MKEITRIHVAKVAYEIETTAKKELEKYITKLEFYANDEELLQDIEIRITELLQERGVKANGVIASADVAALKEKLGDPKEFLGDSDIAVGEETFVPGESARKLYRNVDDAVLGGVMSGIATFFRIDPIWTRLLFVLLLLLSFGVLFLIYIVMWIVVPPARSATEKLQLAGRPITLASIRELNEDEEAAQPARNRSHKAQRVILFGIGLLGTVASLIILGFTVAGVISLSVVDGGARWMGSYQSSGQQGWFAALVIGLCALSGLLLALLFGIGSYAAFARKATHRMGVAIIAIVISGILSFGAAIGIVSLQVWSVNEDVQKSLVERRQDLPATARMATSLVGAVNERTGNLTMQPSIEYSITSDKPYYTVSALPGVKVDLTTDDNTLKLVISDESLKNDHRANLAHIKIKIYGPALQSIDLNNGNLQYTAVNKQDLVVTASQQALVSLTGSFGTVENRLSGQSTSTMSGAAVERVVANLGLDASIHAGTIRELRLTQPVVCPGSESQHLYNPSTIREVTTGQMIYNDANRVAKTIRTTCAEVLINDTAEGYRGTSDLQY